MKEEKEFGGGVGRCHNCGRYFQISNSPDGGTTCSEKCSSEYLEYLNEEIRKPFCVTTIKKVENPTKEFLGRVKK